MMFIFSFYIVNTSHTMNTFPYHFTIYLDLMKVVRGNEISTPNFKNEKINKNK
jgi:hypothetical protein